MEDNFFTTEDFEPEIQDLPEMTEKNEEFEPSDHAKPRKNKYEKASIVFKILAILIFLLSVACGIAFSFTKATTLVPYGMPDMASFKTETIFEVWRTVLFAIVGVSNGLCLWAVAEVFKALGKKKIK